MDVYFVMRNNDSNKFWSYYFKDWVDDYEKATFFKKKNNKYYNYDSYDEPEESLLDNCEWHMIIYPSAG
jgi:hypothetical protein